MERESQIPDDQQEDEDDLPKTVSFKDAVVMNADWTIETIDNQIRKGNIDLQPTFQRRAAWDDTRKSRLIESIIVGMPVPNIVLAENKSHRGRFIVIDGKQRLVSINEFLAGGYRLKGLDMRADLNDKHYDDLPANDKESLDNSTIRATVIKNWSDDDFLYATFYRLNSGSLPLSPQELRKALVGNKLLDSIETYLVQSVTFHQVFGQGLDKRMRDSELVLRFLAFDRALTEYRGDFKNFLDETTRYYESDWAARSVEANAAYERLDAALDVTAAIFGADSFKKWLGDKYERVINRAVFDCIVRFFADQDVAELALPKNAEVVESFKAVCLQVNFKDAVEKTTKTVDATRRRISIWGMALAAVIGRKYDETTWRIV
ncbi:MAG: hypothetical protein CPSOU_2539 [uncultured Paraburkholderia sp.]|nr:MAG: hypothetical protein CPSOU_2539 [uncultured Paraburkholderia sp.]